MTDVDGRAVNRGWLSGLRAAIAAAHAHVPLGVLAETVERLSQRYRDVETAAAGRAAPALRTDLDRRAYVTVRMPATATVLGRVLSETRVRVGEMTGLLDLGAGPLTSLWAATATWPGLDAAILVDRDPALLALGRQLWEHPERTSGPRLELVAADITTYQRPRASVDLVLLSYVIGELESTAATHLLSRALGIARRAVVIVEPGTPHGFARLHHLRRHALEGGARVVAPCPHELACPMQEGDWCHFAARVERSRAHRLAKRGALGWEDEKFAYLVISPTGPLDRAEARVLRHPAKQKGHVTLHVCRDGRVDEIVVTKRADSYRDARHAAWGDAWPPGQAAGRDDEEEPDGCAEGP